MFFTAERSENYAGHGPQYLSAQARVGYAFYEYLDGAVLVVVVREERVSMMTGAGLEAEWCRLRGA